MSALTSKVDISDTTSNVTLYAQWVKIVPMTTDDLKYESPSDFHIPLVRYATLTHGTKYENQRFSYPACAGRHASHATKLEVPTGLTPLKYPLDSITALEAKILDDPRKLSDWNLDAPTAAENGIFEVAGNSEKPQANKNLAQGNFSFAWYAGIDLKGTGKE